MEERLILYGAGGHAKVVANMIEELGGEVTALIDNNMLHRVFLGKYSVYSSLNEFEILSSDKFIVSIGNNESRKRIAEFDLRAKNFDIIKAKTAIVSNYAVVLNGTVVMPGATVNVDVKIGKHCIINTNASIDHDCVLGDFVHISPNVALAGNVIVGEGTHIGIGACVIQGIKIGRWATIGAGTVVIKDVPDGATVVGNPGRVIKINEIS